MRQSLDQRINAIEGGHLAVVCAAYDFRDNKMGSSNLWFINLNGAKIKPSGLFSDKYGRVTQTADV